MNCIFERMRSSFFVFFFPDAAHKWSSGADVIVKKKTCTVGKDHLASKSRNIKPKYWGLRLGGEEGKARTELKRSCIAGCAMMC